MKIQKECFHCLFRQCAQVLRLTSQPPHILERTKNAVFTLLESSKCSQNPPPEVAIKVYETLAKETCTLDIYADIKRECIQKARIIVDILLENKPCFNGIEDELEWAVRLAALGNVIDYGSESEFNIQSEMFDLNGLEFSCFDFAPLVEKLRKSKLMLYFGDNAGENIFDEILLGSIRSHFPNIRLIYFTRGKPIINDITMNDLLKYEECKKIFEICEVKDSGASSPGFLYESSNMDTRKLFDKADVILAKGMGNFECLENLLDSRIFLLFKIKCQVVAKNLNLPVGKMMLRQNMGT